MDAALGDAFAKNPLTQPDALRSLLIPDAVVGSGAENNSQKLNLADYLQKQLENFPNIDPEALREAAERVARYIEGKKVGIDGQPLTDRAADLAKDSLIAEDDALVEKTLVTAASGEPVNRRVALDALLMDASVKIDLADFQEIVNENVVKPVRYSGEQSQQEAGATEASATNQMPEVTPPPSAPIE